MRPSAKFKVEDAGEQRLIWDMAPLSFQIQNATDHATGRRPPVRPRGAVMAR